MVSQNIFECAGYWVVPTYLVALTVCNDGVLCWMQNGGVWIMSVDPCLKVSLTIISNLLFFFTCCWLHSNNFLITRGDIPFSEDTRVVLWSPPPMDGVSVSGVLCSPNML